MGSNMHHIYFHEYSVRYKARELNKICYGNLYPPPRPIVTFLLLQMKAD